jgi:hypothetical protein
MKEKKTKGLVITHSENFLIKQMKFRNYLAISIMCLPGISISQQTTKHYNILWAAFHNTMHLNNKWSVISDAQVRTIGWADQWLLYAFRTGLSYNGAKKFSYAAGIALFRNSVYDNKALLFFKNEWRPWEEVSHNLLISKHSSFLQRLRIEERFLQEVANNRLVHSYNFIIRLRYKFEWQYISPIRNVTFLAANEIFVNPGYSCSPNFFDQNRTFAGFSYKLNANSSFQNQYIKIFQWHNNTKILDDQNIIRITLIQQFNKRGRSKLS